MFVRLAIYGSYLMQGQRKSLMPSEVFTGSNKTNFVLGQRLCVCVCACVRACVHAYAYVVRARELV